MEILGGGKVNEVEFSAAEGMLRQDPRSRARSVLLRLLEANCFDLARFWAETLLSRGVIIEEDKSFVTSSIELALENGHADVGLN